LQIDSQQKRVGVGECLAEGEEGTEVGSQLTVHAFSGDLYQLAAPNHAYFLT
jgi:hypothetical protein